MSVARLLLSGLLVASGLILGAFTLHAILAPEWEVQATAAVRSQRAEVPRVVAADVPDNWAPRLVKVPDPKPPAATDPKTAEAKKKLAEKNEKKKKAKQDEPQTVFSWLTGLLNK
jgi:hypothetical protein